MKALEVEGKSSLKLLWILNKLNTRKHRIEKAARLTSTGLRLAGDIVFISMIRTVDLARIILT